MRQRRQSRRSVGEQPPPDMQSWELKSSVLVEGKEWPDDSLDKRHLQIMYSPSGELRAKKLALNRRRLV